MAICQHIKKTCSKERKVTCSVSLQNSTYVSDINTRPALRRYMYIHIHMQICTGTRIADLSRIIKIMSTLKKTLTSEFALVEQNQNHGSWQEMMLSSKYSFFFLFTTFLLGIKIAHYKFMQSRACLCWLYKSQGSSPISQWSEYSPMMW